MTNLQTRAIVPVYVSRVVDIDPLNSRIKPFVDAACNAGDASSSHCARRVITVAQVIQTGLWRWVKSTGLERFELVRLPQEWMLRGTILVSAESGPAEARYEIVCNDAWSTKRVHVSLRDGTDERVLRVAVEDGKWFVKGQADDSVSGYTDIDLEWSPSTNTLPIRRLHLAVGERSGPVIAAWVRFPSLKLQPLLQEYERVSDRIYRYKSRGGEFVADIAVDEEGLVVVYEGLWQRE